MRDGYKISCLALPPPKVISSNTPSLNDTYIASEAISDLLRTKRVDEILDRQADIVNPLSVLVQPSGCKKRLILDVASSNVFSGRYSL